ncbi:MAG TPA: 6-hydroxymethylpterin diphosphokinase MptE-like protein [Sulfolobales archaeon]|nr:6-hydroxymethylpterin diphosphokinase MptE-like protein [Sulfolobales archaeon]
MIEARSSTNNPKGSLPDRDVSQTYCWDVLRAIDLYRTVLTDMGMDYNAEWDASLTACLIAKSAELREPLEVLEELTGMVRGKEVYVVGAGPSLLNRKLRFREGNVVFCADGACSPIEGEAMVVSVTDLDGGVEPADKVYNTGGYVVLHIHGDNYRNIAINVDLVKRWRKRILITVQTPPPCSSVAVIPGFTDGDRAYLLALSLKAHRIITIGMDLLSEVSTVFSKKIYGEYGYSTINKLRKLRWGYRIIDSLGHGILGSPTNPR